MIFKLELESGTLLERLFPVRGRGASPLSFLLFAVHPVISTEVLHFDEHECIGDLSIWLISTWL